MGTLEHSKIRKARKEAECQPCGAKILKDTHYLSYAPGLRSRVAVCMPCALANPSRWDCFDLRTLLEEERAAHG